MKHIKLFESFDDDFDDDDVDVVYFYVEDGDNKAIVSLRKQGSSWREYLERGDAPYGFGGKTYQSYLKPSDIESWLNKDYDYVEQIDGEDDFDNYLMEAKLSDELTDEQKDQLSKSFRKDFAVDNKFVFDDKFNDKEQEEMLMKKLEVMLKNKNITGDRAEKTKDKWRSEIKKKGIKNFRSDLEKSYIANNPITRRTSKLKSMISNAIWKDVSPFWGDMKDLLAGNPY